MSVQPPTVPARVTLADIHIPFWRMVVIIIKWSLASIPAMIILVIIFGIVAALFGGIISAIVGHMGGARI
jgi:hypothetical protein